MGSVTLVTGNQVEEGPVNAGVVGKFGMERRCHRFSLPHGHRIVSFGRDHFDSGPNALDLGRADEHHLNRSEPDFRQLAFADGAVDLAPIGIAADADIEGAQTCLLRVLDFAGQQDGAGAGSKGRLRTRRTVSAFRNPASPSSLRNVPDSPPGITRPSISSNCSGFLTSTTSAPSSSSRLRCASKSPCRARTPIFIAASPVQPQRRSKLFAHSGL